MQMGKCRASLTPPNVLLASTITLLPLQLQFQNFCCTPAEPCLIQQVNNGTLLVFIGAS